MYATASDVEVDHGPLTADQESKVDALLERAEARVRQVVRDLDDRVTDGRTNVTLVKQVLAEMVTAVLRNPAGYRSQTSTRAEGPYSESRSYTLDASAASGLLRLTNEQRALLGDSPIGAGSFGPAIDIPPAAAYQRPRVHPHGWWP